MNPVLYGAVLFLGGCAATVDPAQCSSAYDLGYRDAIFGMQRQDDVYAPLCARQGSSIDVTAYGEGWKDGHLEFEKRTPHTE